MNKKKTQIIFDLIRSTIIKQIGLLMANNNDEMILIEFSIQIELKTVLFFHRLVVMILELQSFHPKAACIRLNMQWKPYRMPEPVWEF